MTLLCSQYGTTFALTSGPPAMMSRDRYPKSNRDFPDRDSRGPLRGGDQPGYGLGPGPSRRYGGPTPPSNQSYGRQQSRRHGESGISLLIRNLCSDITVRDLGEAFGRLGDIKDVYIPKDFHSKMPKRFGFVEFANREQAAKARDEMDQVILKGRKIEVCFAQEKRKSSNEMRGKVSDMSSNERVERLGGDMAWRSRA